MEKKRAKKLVVAKPAPLSIDKSSVDLSKCCICQDKNKDNLVCPGRNKNSSKTLSSYNTLADNLCAFKRIGELDSMKHFDGLDEGLGIAATLSNYEAKWHKSCRLQYNDTKLKRAQKRFEARDQIPESSRRTRSSLPPTVMPSVENVCFLCTFPEKRNKKLHLVTTLELSERVKEWANYVMDARLIGMLQTGDLVALEAKYHHKCLLNLRNRCRKNSSSGRSETSVCEAIAFAELVAYMQDKMESENYDFVFPMSTLTKMYKERLAQLLSIPESELPDVRSTTLRESIQMARYYAFRQAIFEERERRKLHRRAIRDLSNPFEMPDAEFRRIYRMRKDVALYICDELEADLQPNHADGLPAYIKVLTSLHFLADGSYQRGIGQDHGLSVAQSTVSHYLGQFTNAVCRRLMARWVSFPGTDRDRRSIANAFEEEHGVRNILGVIDCTQVKIFPPPQPRAQYQNRKGMHALNVQLVADVDCKIIGVNARYPGRVHDSFIFNYSNIKEELRRLHDHHIGDYFLLGDSGYALEPWLMTPVRDAAPNTPEARYTDWHCSVRSIIERTNCYLKNIFRCLGHDRVLRYSPTKSSEIVNTCCVIYNIMKHFRCLPPEEPLVNVNEAQENDDALRGVPQNGLLLRVAEQKRARLINTYFNYYFV